MYQIMLSIGTIGMLLCIFRRRGLFNLRIWQCCIFTLLLTAVGVAGAMLLYYLECGSIGGVSFYGSVFLIPLLMPLAGFPFGLKPEQTMDLCGPCVAVMIGCMRFSCFLTGCCGGWSVSVGGLSFEWPTQVMDSVGDFMIMTWLLLTEDKHPHGGKLYPMFMIAYSAMRFCLEFLRETPKDWLFLSHGQWFAIAALLIGLLWCVWNDKTAKYARNKAA